MGVLKKSKILTKISIFIFILPVFYTVYAKAKDKYDVTFIRVIRRPKKGPFDRIAIDITKRGRIITITRISRTRCEHILDNAQQVLSLEDSAQLFERLNSFVKRFDTISSEQKQGQWCIWYGHNLTFKKFYYKKLSDAPQSIFLAYLWLSSLVKSRLYPYFYTNMPPVGRTCTLNIIMDGPAKEVLVDHWKVVRSDISMELPCGYHIIQIKDKQYKIKLQRNLVETFRTSSP